MILANTTDELKIVTSGAQQLDIYISYVDNTSTTFVPDNTQATITSATTTTLLTGPSASTQRQVKTIDITNVDPADQNDIQVEFYDGSTTVILYTGTIAAGQSIQYTGTAWGVGGSGGGAVSSVAASDGSLTVTPVIGAVTAKINLSNSNTWTGQQIFTTTSPRITTLTAGSVPFIGTGGLIVEDNTNLFFDDTNNQLTVGGATGFSTTNNTPLNIGGSANNYYQAYIQNASTGTGASSDFIAGADNDGVGFTGHYVDMGIECSGNTSSTLTAADDGYFYCSGGNVAYGTDDVTKVIKFFVGSYLSGSSEIARVSATGMTVGLAGTLGGSLTFAGSTSGGVSIVAPAVGGSNVQTLQAATGTIALTSDIPSGVITRSISSISTPTTAGATANTDYVYFVTGTTTLTLPTAVGNTNMYTIKCVSGTTTIATTSAQTIDGSASASLPVANTSLSVISNNSNWLIV